MTELVWTEQQQRVLDVLNNTNDSVFLTGNAGTGKSTLINHWLESQGDNVAVLAPTAIAALNINGCTIHRFFGLPGELVMPDMAADLLRDRTVERLENVQTILIDEVSMVRADIFATMDQMLKYVNVTHKPFGGVRLILVGDLLQLPPVVKDPDRPFMKQLGAPGGWFFRTEAFRELDPKRFNLTQGFRQKDPTFYELLNRVRAGDTRAVLDVNRVAKDAMKAPKTMLQLCSTNRLVDEINWQALKSLPGEKGGYEGTITGEVKDSQLPLPKELMLGIGARVMTVKNKYAAEGGPALYLNGMIGTMQAFEEESVLVKFDDGRTASIPYDTWEFIDYAKVGGKLRRVVKGSFKQIPIKLAWALTTHKSQGQGFDAAVVNMGYGSFAHGQLYVALSRLRQLDGLFLTRKLRPSDVIVDAEVLKFQQETSA